MKAQMYSLITLVLVIPLLLFIIFFIPKSQDIKTDIMKKIIADQEHQIAKNIEEDFERAVKISGRRALLTAINRIVINGEYLDNASLRLKELVLNGSLYGTPQTLMQNNTLEDWKKRILSINTGFYTSVNYSNLEIKNYDGFNLEFSAELTLNISHPFNLSRIDKTLKKDVLISVLGLEDPFFPLNTNGYVKRTVRRYEYPFYAKKIVSGVSSGNCSGMVSFDKDSPDPDRILVTYDGGGVTGFRGVVAETSNIPGTSCYIIGASNAVALINQTIQKSGYSIIHLDNLTASVWSIPLLAGIENERYYPSPGPNFLQRMEGDFSSSPDGKGIESFVTPSEGIYLKNNQTRTDYLYFDNSTHLGCYKARWVMEDWIRMNEEEISRYNLTGLNYSVC